MDSAQQSGGATPRVLVVGDPSRVSAAAAALRNAGMDVDQVPQRPEDPGGYDLVLAPAQAGDGPAPASATDEHPSSSRSPAPGGLAPSRRAGEAIEVDDAARAVRVRGHRLDLTGREFALLRHLTRNPGAVFTRDELLETVWHAPTLSDGAVTEYIRRLRIHLEPFGLGGCIRTRHGFGYYFDAEAPVL